MVMVMMVVVMLIMISNDDNTLKDLHLASVDSLSEPASQVCVCSSTLLILVSSGS